MTTESNPMPRFDWGTIANIIASVITSAVAALALWFSFTASLDHRFELQQQQFQLQQERMDASVSEIRALSGADVREIRQLIQASEANRQADARAINARVDVAEQLILASHIAPEISSSPPHP